MSTRRSLPERQRGRWLRGSRPVHGIGAWPASYSQPAMAISQLRETYWGLQRRRKVKIMVRSIWSGRPLRACTYLRGTNYIRVQSQPGEGVVSAMYVCQEGWGYGMATRVRCIRSLNTSHNWSHQPCGIHHHTRTPVYPYISLIPVQAFWSAQKAYPWCKSGHFEAKN